MSTNPKQGEAEAKLILERHGVELNDSYCDDNSMSGMADLQCKDGRYIEVTHTRNDQRDPLKHNEQSSETILESIRIKAEKHPSGTDLFIFVTKNEYDSLLALFDAKKGDAAHDDFMDTVLASPFNVIYICVWDYYLKKYNTVKPTMFIIRKRLSIMSYGEL